MTHLDFIVWFLGFPLMWELSNLITSKYRAEEMKTLTKGQRAFNSLVFFFLWVGIGKKLW